MSWYRSADVEEFAAQAGDFLRSRRAEHTIQLTAIEQVRSGAFTPAASYAWWRGPDGEVASAYLRMPPYPGLLSEVPEPAWPGLLDILAGVDAVDAEVGVADELLRRLGARPEVGRRSRLYRLGTLTPPDPEPAGRARLAGPGDRDLLAGWFRDFLAEAGGIDDGTDEVGNRLGYGGMLVWEVDGAPVSMAGRTRVAAGMVRIGPVYTPPALRHNGYAAAVTAAISAQAREYADEVLLFTDLANPTSNGVYQRIGYRPVHDRVYYSGLSAATSRPG